MTKFQTRYHVVAEVKNEQLATCGHEHRSRDAAAGCRWQPAGREYDRLVIRPFDVEKRGAGSDRGHVSVPGALYDRLKIEGEARNASISQMVEEAVEPALIAWEQSGG